MSSHTLKKIRTRFSKSFWVLRFSGRIDKGRVGSRYTVFVKFQKKMLANNGNVHNFLLFFIESSTNKYRLKMVLTMKSF